MKTKLILLRQVTLAALSVLVLWSAVVSEGRCQAPEVLPAPKPLDTLYQPTLTSAAISLDGEGQVFPIDLLTALHLAQTKNLDIAQARAVVDQVRALQQRANVLVLPNFSIGSTYVHHEGQIQKTEGNIITVNRDSLFVGGGPSLTFQSADALFGPVVARDVTRASLAGLQRVNNDTLLQVAEAYFNILRARRRLARTQEILSFLVDPKPAANRGQSKGLLPLVRDVVEVGGKDAFRSDLERVRVEVLRREDERRAALQDLEVATAELARLLHIDARTPLWPIENYRFPIDLPGEAWFHQPIDPLVAAALSNRPELAENRALVQAALDRVRAAKYRPLLPNIALNYNWGDFGGGPDLNAPVVVPATRTAPARIVQPPGFGPSGQIHKFSTRTDFDASVFWRLQNMGFGNRAEIKEQKALYERANFRQLQIQDQVVTQVVQSYEQLRGWWDRLEIARSSLFNERGEPQGPAYLSIRLNFERIRGAEGRPLEAQDSIRGLSDTLEAYYQAVTDYERSRFRLLTALGMPAESILNPDLMPMPPCDPTLAAGGDEAAPARSDEKRVPADLPPPARETNPK